MKLLERPGSVETIAQEERSQHLYRKPAMCRLSGLLQLWGKGTGAAAVKLLNIVSASDTMPTTPFDNIEPLYSATVDISKPVSSNKLEVMTPYSSTAKSK